MAHNKYKKDIRRALAKDRQDARDSFINKDGLDAYVQIRKALEIKHPNGAKKETGKLDKLIKLLNKNRK
jgi:hypothetical protein